MLMKVENVTKQFRIKKKEKGIKNFFKPKYDKITAVDNINLNINKGELVAFIGKNGAGKSTTIKLLTGILHPTNGEITIDGLNPIKDRKKLAYKIGCMFGQKSQLYMHLSVYDSYVLLGGIYDIPKDKLQSKIDEVSRLFKIEHLLPLTVRKLSLGQRMICEIAGSILHEPEILFLDEPTIGLDIIAKHRIREIISTLNKEKGTTIFLTSHDLSDIEALCRRIIIISDGKIIKDCSIDELKHNFLTKRNISIYYDDKVLKQDYKYPITDIHDNTISLSVDTKKHTIGAVISYFSKIGNVADIQIEPVPLEEIITKLYESGDTYE